MDAVGTKISVNNMDLDHRRLRRLEIDPAILIQMFVEDGKCWKCIDSEIPLFAEFRGMAQDPGRNTWNIFFSSPTFDIVPPGCEVPAIRAPSINTVVLKDKIYEVIE